MPPTPRRAATRGRTRRRVRKNIAIGQAHIKTSFNNTIVSLTDGEGNVIAWESAGSAGGLPSDHVALAVGERDDRVVERRLDVRLADRDVLANAAARATTGRGSARSGRHQVFVAAFLPRPTVFFGPLRVRALVLVRWPCTGRPRRWRRPR